MVRIGIIGTGGMANAHADNLSKIKGVRITACCDISEERAAAFAAKWHVDDSYSSYEDMFRAEKLDGVCIVTSDAVHAPAALAAMARGVGVLCEKPLASTLGDARAMAAAARKHRVVNMVNFTKRNGTGLQEIARRVRKGDIGEIRHFEARYLQGWIGHVDWKHAAENSGAVWRSSTAGGNAGTLSDLGCHVYDAARLVCGDFAEIQCTFGRYEKGVGRVGTFKLDAPDSFFSTVTFSNGVVGEIHSTRWADGFGDSVQLIISGTKGTFSYDIEKNFHGYRWYLPKTREWKDVTCKPHPSTWQRFVRALKTGKNDQPDFGAGVAIQAYLHHSIESDRLDKPVRIRL
jgi:predicted dehydrogenase